MHNFAQFVPKWNKLQENWADIFQLYQEWIIKFTLDYIGENHGSKHSTMGFQSVEPKT